MSASARHFGGERGGERRLPSRLLVVDHSAHGPRGHLQQHGRLRDSAASGFGREDNWRFALLFVFVYFFAFFRVFDFAVLRCRVIGLPFNWSSITLAASRTLLWHTQHAGCNVCRKAACSLHTMRNAFSL